MADILVCEDDAAVREMLDIALSTEGYRVEVVEDGTAALERLDAKPVDLVVLDVMMPGATGYEVLEQLRTKDDWAQSRIVLLTALSDDSEVWRGWAAGADYYLTKPFDLGHLRDVIHRLLTGLPVS